MCGFIKSLSSKTENFSILKEKERERIYSQLQKNLETDNSPIVTTQKERQLVERVENKTKINNVNNVTRTKAYLEFFNRNPEIHWAFLAHMVSRNGGYHMTDLRGTLVGGLLDEEKRVDLFHFLEHANYLIFQDAYPQLLLYEESKQNNSSYFYLLKLLHISKFMYTAWEYFFKTKNSAFITYSLITNEQNYIEKHLFSTKGIKSSLFHTLAYVIQEKLGFTHVIFPYKRNLFSTNYSLVGLEIHDCSSIQKRINIGKCLYSILFSKKYYKSCLKFATNQPHTASRSDYWPHIFSLTSYNSAKSYSPPLEVAWGNIQNKSPSTVDWFQDINQIKDFDRYLSYIQADITKNVLSDVKFLSTLNKIIH